MICDSLNRASSLAGFVEVAGRRVLRRSALLVLVLTLISTLDTLRSSADLPNSYWGKISAQSHPIVKQICFPNGNLLFLSLFSISKN